MRAFRMDQMEGWGRELPERGGIFSALAAGKSKIAEVAENAEKS